MASATSGATAQPIVPTPATATTAPGRIFVSIARRLIAAMSFLLRSNAFFEPCRSHNICICHVKSFGPLQRSKLSSPLVSRRIRPTPCRSIGVFIRAGQGFFLSTRAKDIGIICLVAARRFLIAVPVSTPSMRIDCGRQRHRTRDFTYRSISRLVIACTFLAVLSSSATAQARPPFRVGGLTCNTDPRVGLVLGSRQDMRCVFVASATGQQYVYTGTIRRLGIDIGVTRGGTLFWAVFARNSQIGRGTLRGNYVGASGNVAVGLGVGFVAIYVIERAYRRRAHWWRS